MSIPLYTLRAALLLLALLPILSCSEAAVTGVRGNAMVVPGIADTAIKVKPPLVAQGYGRTMSGIPADGIYQPTVILDYAIFGEGTSGPINKSAHVMVATLTTRDSWMFSMESFARRNEFMLTEQKINGRGWTVHLLHEESSGDWVSSIWEANKRAVPTRWLAKRWSRTTLDYIRTVVEYREPLPPCMQVGSTEGQELMVNAIFMGMTGECKRELDAFVERADHAFEFYPAEGYAPSEQTSPRILTQVPNTGLNLARLVGTAQALNLIDF